MLALPATESGNGVRAALGKAQESVWRKFKLGVIKIPASSKALSRAKTAHTLRRMQRPEHEAREWRFESCESQSQQYGARGPGGVMDS